MNRDALRARLKREEGLRLTPYQDAVGAWTIGYGHNLTARGISQAVAEQLLEEDIDATLTALAALPWYPALSPLRQLVIADMAFNLGVEGLCGFTKMLKAIGREDWERASDEMLASQWAEQVGYRAARLARMMRTDAP